MEFPHEIPSKCFQIYSLTSLTYARYELHPSSIALTITLFNEDAPPLEFG